MCVREREQKCVQLRMCKREENSASKEVFMFERKDGERESLSEEVCFKEKEKSACVGACGCV